MSAMIGWTDHAQGGTISTAADPGWLMDASNMLLPGGPTRARWDSADPLVFVLDLGAAKRIDAICFAGINASTEWDIDISLGLASVGSIGPPSMQNNEYSSARALRRGSTVIIPLGQSYTARYISVSADWDIGSAGFYDIRRMLAMECLRLRGMPISSSMINNGNGVALLGQTQGAEISAGVHWRAWQVAMNNLTLAQLYGDEDAPGVDPSISDLAGNWSNEREVLLVPRTDNAHMIYQTAILGRVSGPIQFPGRARGDSRTQYTQFPFDELLYRA